MGVGGVGRDLYKYHVGWGVKSNLLTLVCVCADVDLKFANSLFPLFLILTSRFMYVILKVLLQP